MKFKNLLEGEKLTRFVLVAWLVSSAIIGLLLYEIDQIVNVELYNYGLQFNMAWASGYWVFVRLICASILVPAVLSGAALVSVFMRKDKSEHSSTPKPKEKNAGCSSNQYKEGVQMLISCPKCKKVFGKPMVMLDFNNGKTKLVSVCPYCNNELSSVDQEEGSSIRPIQNEETTLPSQDNPPLWSNS